MIDDKLWITLLVLAWLEQCLIRRVPSY